MHGFIRVLSIGYNKIIGCKETSTTAWLFVATSSYAPLISLPADSYLNNIDIKYCQNYIITHSLNKSSCETTVMAWEQISEVIKNCNSYIASYSIAVCTSSYIASSLRPYSTDT